jgi:hypothetical protein
LQNKALQASSAKAKDKSKEQAPNQMKKETRNELLAGSFGGMVQVLTGQVPLYAKSRAF